MKADRGGHSVDFERERAWWDAKASSEETDRADEAINRALRWREITRRLDGVRTVLDVGGGTGRVGRGNCPGAASAAGDPPPADSSRAPPAGCPGPMARGNGSPARGGDHRPVTSLYSTGS